MNTETIGFCIGVIPGLAIIFKNMRRQLMLQKHIESAAWSERSWNDTQLGFKQQFNLLFHPERYVTPDDSPALVAAKQALLSAWPQIWRQHWIGGVVMVVGTITGIVVGAALA